MYPFYKNIKQNSGAVSFEKNVNYYFNGIIPVIYLEVFQGFSIMFAMISTQD